MHGAPPGFMDQVNMLFGGGFGPPGNMQVDPSLIENLFGPGAAQGFANANMTPQAQTRREGEPIATSKSTYRSLPRVKVTAYDIEKNESNECSICLDELVLGQPALRIPCGHLFHEDCIEDWLKKSNECPVCRFELPTDDAQYEEGRRARMADRKIRLSKEDIKVKSAQELRRFAQFLKIDIKGCLEKAEIVDRIAASGQVEIVEGRENVAPSSLFDYANGNHSDMRAPEYQWDDVNMGTGPQEATSSTSPPDAPEKWSSSDATMSDAPQPATTAPTPAAPPLRGQSVSQLRQLARQLGVSLDGCIEKADIVQRISEAPGYRNL
jgi:hypothetical protein